MSLDQNASNAVLRRRYQSRLPLEFDARNRFNTPGARPSYPPDVTRSPDAPRTGATAQPRATDPPRDINPHQRVSTPPGHFSNPFDNMIAAESRLEALAVIGESPVVVEARKAVELLQTEMAQQAAYSYSRDRIHSTLCYSRSYSRHAESPALSVAT